jgi:regulator of RNase E activity RraA
MKDFERLNRIDTPTITNVVASYHKDEENCLGLYDPWTINWYTDDSIRCMYPELGARSGYAVTCVYGPPNDYTRLGFGDVLRAIEKSPKPVILCIRQDFPEALKRKNGLCGGNMMTAMKVLGAVGVISDGPSRDVDEIRPMGMQYLITGTSPGHGAFSVKAVNVPVRLCGMDVAPGEIVHMDENGACKFPADQVEKVCELGERLLAVESHRQALMRESNGAEGLIRILGGFEDPEICR